jgi:hypothetical protein
VAPPQPQAVPEGGLPGKKKREKPPEEEDHGEGGRRQGGTTEWKQQPLEE